MRQALADRTKVECNIRLKDLVEPVKDELTLFRKAFRASDINSAW